jgi:hypothetical protein
MGLNQQFLGKYSYLSNVEIKRSLDDTRFSGKNWLCKQGDS